MFQVENAAVEYKGTVFSGEAPESDDEILAFSNVKLGNALEVTEVYKPTASKTTHKEVPQELSLLQKCLGKRYC